MAGLNAALKLSGADPFTLDRTQAYIGVMIDDLITHGAPEPYRMFTSRAEYRLSLRADNADQRLTGIGLKLGCIGAEREEAFTAKMAALEQARILASSLSATPNELARHEIHVNHDGVRRNVLELLSYPEISLAALGRIWPELRGLPDAIVEQIEIDGRYAGYMERQDSDIRAFRKDENLLLPLDLDVDAIGGLSAEARQKLQNIRPGPSGAAARMPGVTPAAIIALLRYVRRREEAA